MFLNLNPSNQTNFVILALWTSKDQTSFYFLSRSQLVVDECGNSSFNNKNPTNATPTSLHSFLRSWTETRNRTGRCDCLHLIVSSSSKIPRAPTISRVLSSHNKPHSHWNPPKTWQRWWLPLQMLLKVLSSFIISLDLVPKMQMLDLLFPS